MPGTPMDMTITRRTAVAGLLTAAAEPVPAALPDRLAPSAMTADVALLRHAYETLHPGLYRYQTPAESAARFDAFAAAVARPMSPGAFYLLLSRHLATLRCGHCSTTGRGCRSSSCGWAAGWW